MASSTVTTIPAVTSTSAVESMVGIFATKAHTIIENPALNIAAAAAIAGRCTIFVMTAPNPRTHATMRQ
jgi:hypothetical protein